MKRLRRSEVIHPHQSEFSPILFDVLFGLLIFLGIGSFGAISGATQWTFFLASIAIVIHWWMKYKAAEDAFGVEVSNSSLDLLFGVTEIALLQMAMLAAAKADYVSAVMYFALPLVVESVWALLWRFFGKWRHSSRQRVRYMEQELEWTVFLNLGAAALLGTLIAFSPLLADADLTLCFVWAYVIYVVMTYRCEIIDVKLF